MKISPSCQLGQAPFIETENREGRVDFGVDEDTKFTFEQFKFEAGQENTRAEGS